MPPGPQGPVNRDIDDVSDPVHTRFLAHASEVTLEYANVTVRA